MGITDAVASARLKELTEAGIFTKVPYQEPGQRVRYEYLLTDMGRDLFPVVMSLMQWGNEHLQPDGPPLTVTDTSRNPIRVGVVTGEQETLGPDDVEVRVPAGLAESGPRSPFYSAAVRRSLVLTNSPRPQRPSSRP
ncbi:helix-turn-helix transcriptional regulator [Gordonia amicalis]|nr:helix-turn-helix transcriptional regulator [Gordonia amicalis]NKX77594.1 helix-turn-helix transcriptional regulator [Gordonia amicalis]